MLNTNLLRYRDYWFHFTMKALADIQILCVDDEQEVLASLKRTLRKSNCKKAFVESGEQALAFMADHHVDILISDMRMPKMSGAQLFTHVENHSPDTFKILLTGFSDLDSTIEAINRGSINKYLQKPWKNDQLMALVDDGIEHARLRDEINGMMGLTEKHNKQLRLLNENLEETVEKRTRQIHNALQKIDSEYKAIHQLLFNLIRIHPYLDERFAHQVSRLCARLAEVTPSEDLAIGALRLAGLLSEIGMIGLDQGIITLPVNELKYDQLKAFKGQVIQAQQLLQPASHLKNVREIIVNQYEQPDGKGVPKGKPAEQISAGAKILTVARDYWRWVSGRQTGTPVLTGEAIMQMKKFKDILYDGTVLEALSGLADLSASGGVIKSLTTQQLEPGMVLKENLSNENKLLMLAEGHVFTEDSIEKLSHLEKTQGITLQIKVED